jgi:hypothetical protein
MTRKSAPHSAGLRPRQIVVPAAAETSAARSVFDVVRGTEPADDDTPQIPPQRMDRLWLALGSDGCLLIRRGGRMETYDRAETQEIARYFASIGLEAWGAAA